MFSRPGRKAQEAPGRQTARPGCNTPVKGKAGRIRRDTSRNLSAYDRSALALQLEPLYQAEAKRRQATSTGGKNPQLTQNSAEPENKGETRDKLATLAGVSHDTLRKVKVIENEANAGNETAANVV